MRIGRIKPETWQCVKGLEQVLVRYTGYAAISGFAEVANELDSAKRYVIEYGVETVEVEAEDQLGKEERDALWVRYNASLIDQLVQELELPIWPTLRPTVAYVVVTERWGQPHVPSVQEYPALVIYLERIFKQRGVASQRISASALRGISANDLWNVDQQVSDQLRAASDADISLLIRVHAPDRVETQDVDFLFLDAETETLLKRSAPNLLLALDQGIDTYIDRLSASLAFLGGGESEFDLYIQILGVRGYAEYRQVLDQIAGLEQVLSVRIENATDQSVGYLIRYQSDQQLLVESIMEITGVSRVSNELDALDTLVPVSDIDIDMPGSAESPIYFRYPNPTFTLSPEAINLAKPDRPEMRQTEGVPAVSSRQEQSRNILDNQSGVGG